MTQPNAGASSAAYGATGIPTTREQAIATLQASMLLRYLNATPDQVAGTAPGFGEPYWANDYFAKHGIQLPPPGAFGSLGNMKAGQTAPAQDPALWAIFGQLATAYIGETQPNLPSIPGSTNPTANPNTTATIAGNAATQAASDAAALARQQAADAAAAARNAASDAAAVERAKIAEEGANARNAATIASTDKNAAADREAAAAKTAADNAAKERISDKDRVESGRQFDITTAEGARQFNTSSLMTLLDKGIQLAKQPVDWIAYQFYTKNLGIPMNALNMNALTGILGAIPPSGPSAAGPFTGGAGAMFGDTAQAQAAGVQAQAVSVAQAIQANPGDGGQAATGQVHPELQQITATTQYPQWVQAAGGADQLEKQVAQGRANEVAQIVGDNPVTQQMRDYAQQIIAQTAPAAPGGPSMPAVPGATPNEMNGEGGMASPWQQRPATPDGYGPDGVSAPGIKVNAGTQMQAPAVPQPLAPPPVPAPQSYQPTQPLTAPSQAPQGGDIATRPGGPISVANGAPVQTGGSVGGAPGNASGIYTGVAQTHDAAVAPTGAVGVQPATQTGVQAPAQNEMLAHLAQQLGMSYEQISQLVPANLIAGGYSADTIAKTPVIQALNGSQDSLGYYHTDPTQTKFNTIQAFGTPVSFRGGQDINAQSYLNTTDANQQMLEGAVNATGQSWPDVQKQMLRASPLSNYDAGAFGRRVY